MMKYEAEPRITNLWTAWLPRWGCGGNNLPMYDMAGEEESITSISSPLIKVSRNKMKTAWLMAITHAGL